MTHVTRWFQLALLAVFAATAGAQGPPPMTAKGCCCVAQGVSWRCSDRTQADCLAAQPNAPTFNTKAEWKKMFADYAAASWKQADTPNHGGWIAEACGSDIDPATGEPRGAPTGCCCIPKAAGGGQDCKAGATHFVCKAECAMFKDGRKPEDCTWAAGACAK